MNLFVILQVPPQMGYFDVLVHFLTGVVVAWANQIYLIPLYIGCGSLTFSLILACKQLLISHDMGTVSSIY